MLSINTNVNALQAGNQIGATQSNLGNSMEKLTTGLRINRAADDVAGTALSSRFETFANRNETYIKNAEDGINMIQTFEGALKQTESLIQRMSTLATQAENGTQTAEDRALIQQEFDQLVEEVTRNAKNASYNGINLTSNAALTAATPVDVVVGQGTDNVISLAARDMEATALGDVTNSNFVNGIDLTDTTTLGDSDDWKELVHDVLDAAAAQVNDFRADLGSKQNRLEFSVTNLTNVGENASQAISSMRDTDFASETAELAKQQVLAQTSQAMLKQANEQTQSVAQLVQ